MFILCVHVFGFTSITEAGIGAAPPGNNIAQWPLHRDYKRIEGVL